MDIVIAGAGKVGEELCCDLSKENHNIILIELNETRLDQLTNMYDIGGVLGNGGIYDVQAEAGVNDCDIFIAVTPNDETNIIAAITAKKLGAKYTIARVRNPDYFKQMNFLRESLGISMMINPELEAAHDIVRMLMFPAALNVEYFEQGRVNMVEVVLQSDAPMAGMKLKDYNGRYGNVLICIVVRGDKVLIPDGETRLEAGDHVMVTGSNADVTTFCRHNQHRLSKISSVLIIGGGKLTHYLLSLLVKTQIRIKVIEADSSIADKLAADFPQAEIIFGDGTKQMFLNEERFTDYDSVISLLGIDEENILISIYASRMGVEKTITKVNRTDLLKVLDNVGLQSIVTPQQLIADQIIRFVRSTENTLGSNINAFYRLANGRVEVLQFHVKETSRTLYTPLTELSIKPGLLIACIIRENSLIYPSGSDMILPGDDVIIVTTNKNFQNIDDIIK
ncbi:MAG: Trk system potassium transporter TrkA [Oscillospiraceae bacterium]|nr:Trk system potassium transporter TrkA [Oscillospiraceae bacterium]